MPALRLPPGRTPPEPVDRTVLSYRPPGSSWGGQVVCDPITRRNDSGFGTYRDDTGSRAGRCRPGARRRPRAERRRGGRRGGGTQGVRGRPRQGGRELRGDDGDRQPPRGRGQNRLRPTGTRGRTDRMRFRITTGG